MASFDECIHTCQAVRSRFCLNCDGFSQFILQRCDRANDRVTVKIQAQPVVVTRHFYAVPVFVILYDDTTAISFASLQFFCIIAFAVASDFFRIRLDGRSDKSFIDGSPRVVSPLPQHGTVR